MASDPRLPTSDLRPPTSDHRLKILIILTLFIVLQVLQFHAILNTGLASQLYGYGYFPTPQNILINEFVSRPDAGEPEWIELYNPEQTAFSLSNCQLADATGSIHTFPDYSSIAAEDFELIELSRSKLNNGGDHLLLICADEIIDELRYGIASLNSSLTANPPLLYSTADTS